MSHVATIDIEVKDLDALAAAAKQIGLEFVRDQKTYNWWGKHVGDFPLPEGFTASDLGKCDHALRIAGEDIKREGRWAPYEIGVVKRRDGRPGYTLLWDFAAGGMGLKAKVGDGCCNLKREYARVVAIKTARQQGFAVHEQRRQDGSVQLVLSK